MNSDCKRAKYIFVTGGVVSGLGKGITAASLGRLLKERGLKVAAQKFDPYINVDPGTMSPLQHGEVFVTDDGAETDLDLGHYERFIDESLNKYSSNTTGKVYLKVLENERNGEYLGSTIQVIPHITDEIKRRMYRVAETTDADIVISEIGGTVGDIESLPYLESIRQIGRELGMENVLYIHVTLVPYLYFSGEHKSKPTQHSVKELLSVGIQPDIIICRTDEPMETGLLEKIAMFCGVKRDCVIENTTVANLYEVPLMLEKSNFSDIVCRELKIDAPKPVLSEWENLIASIKTINKSVKIALVGKYVKLHDAYLSVTEALHHGGFENLVDIEMEWVDSETLNNENAAKLLKGADGIIVPGGFGVRGTDGMFVAANYARINNVPFFGICMGMQTAIIAFARSVAGLKNADSGEFDPNCTTKVVDIMPEQLQTTQMGATMRLGKYPCSVSPKSILADAYKSDYVEERHRHRYEINNDYREILEKNGLRITGQSPNRMLIEAFELPSHPWYVGVQYHPELKSRPNRAHPLYREFIAAAKKYNDSLGR